MLLGAALFVTTRIVKIAIAEEGNGRLIRTANELRPSEYIKTSLYYYYRLAFFTPHGVECFSKQDVKPYAEHFSAATAAEV